MPEGQPSPQAGSSPEPASAGRRPVPTLVAVQEGRLVVLPGDPDGPRPVVEPGANVKLFVNGKPVDRPRLVEPGDQLEAQAGEVPPRVTVSVRLADDFMKAYLVVERLPGKRFALADAPPSPRLRVEARFVEEIPAPLPSPEEVRQALEQAQVRFGIKEEVVRRVCVEAVPSGTPLLVAEGTPPVPPQDGRAELRFEERQSLAVDPEAERIDLFERGAVTWVEPGTELAVIEAPKDGVPGTDVRGRTIAVPRARPAAVRAGKGCKLSEDGTRIVAVEAGRPHFEGGILQVLPVFEVKGDVDVSTGHVRFSGDVVVRGDVLEGLEVQAGGEVRVGGLVSRAKVRAGGSVMVGRTIIASRVEAGGQASAVQEILPVLAPLCGQLQSLLAVARELKERTDGAPERIGGGVVPSRLSDGELVKRLTERKFWDIPRLARQLGKLADRLDALCADGRRLAEKAAQMLVGMGPLRVGRLSEVEDLASRLQQALDSVQALSAREADVMAYSVQNAHIEASGRIVIRGSGAFNSTLLAGRGVEARRGVVRGGLVSVAEGDVMVRELGGPTGVPTTVVVARRGKVVATTVYPHVTLSIAGQKHTFPDGARSLRAYLGADGTLVVEHLKGDFGAIRNLSNEAPEPGQRAGTGPGRLTG